MAECNYVEVCPTRRVDGAQFPLGVMEFPISVGVPNALRLSKSYFRVSMSVYGGGHGPTAPTPSEMVALADNVVGNLFDNAYVRSNNVEISSIMQGAAQASALNARLGNGYSWLKSMGVGAELNESLFTKRVMYTASGTPPDPSLMTANEMYRPVATGTFATAEVDITTGTLDDLEIKEGALVPASTPLSGGDWGPVPLNDTNVGVGTFLLGGVVTCADGKFNDGMPNPTTGAPTGGPVLPGDILVVAGIPYVIESKTNATTLQLANIPATAIANEANWYIVRKDVIRAPQALNTVYAVWQPPIGLFNYDGPLGSGEFRIQLNPNSNYLLAGLETRNPQPTVSADGLTGSQSIIINDVKFYAYIEKTPIPDSVQDLNLMEYQVQSKPWQSNLQFSVSPYTTAITIFVQDLNSGASPLYPPSMFKVSDNSDLKLQKIQVSYGGVTKPSINWDSNFYNGADQLQQRYHDSYEESGMDVKSGGCETYHDWLQRGPIYHFTFPRDMNNRATEVMVNTIFNGLVNGPGTGTGGTGIARVFCVSHQLRKVQITTAAGALVQVSAMPRS